MPQSVEQAGRHPFPKWCKTAHTACPQSFFPSARAKKVGKWCFGSFWSHITEPVHFPAFVDVAYGRWGTIPSEELGRNKVSEDQWKLKWLKQTRKYIQTWHRQTLGSLVLLCRGGKSIHIPYRSEKYECLCKRKTRNWNKKEKCFVLFLIHFLVICKN